MPSFTRWVLPLLALGAWFTATPAAAVSSGSVSLSYAIADGAAGSGSIEASGGGPPEEGNPPLPLDVTLTTPEVGGNPADPFVGLHGAVVAEVPSGPSTFVQFVGAEVGGVPFESPFGGTVEDTIVWSNDPVGSGPYNVSAQASVLQEQRYLVVDQSLSVTFDWSGGLFFFANSFDSGVYEYGYSFTAQIFSNVEDGFYGSFPEIGALGGPALTVSGSETLSQPNEAFPGGSQTVDIFLTSPFDVGNYMRVALQLDVWIEGDFELGQFGLVQNLVDFTGTLGVTSLGGAVAVPEPDTPLLALAALGAFVAWGRRARPRRS